MSSLFIKNLYSRCKMHGNSDAQVLLSDDELYALIVIALNDLGWLDENLHAKTVQIPNDNYYAIPIDWFATLQLGVTVSELLKTLESAKHHHEDFCLYIENLSALHRRRVKYRRILSIQPLPTMDQIGPRGLLEFGSCDSRLLANWMTWRNMDLRH